MIHTHISLSPAKQTSMSSRVTSKESQNSSVTTTYSVGFNHDAELLHKK